MKRLDLMLCLLSFFKCSLLLEAFLLVHLLVFSAYATEKKDERLIPMGASPKVKAQNNIEYVFAEKSLKDLTILDVGLYGGYNAKVMTKNGATVYTLDEDKESLEEAIREKRLLKERSIHAIIGDCSGKKTRICPDFCLIATGWEECFNKLEQTPVLDREYDGRFDIITIFRVAFNEGRVAKRLSDLLKPEGTLVIGYASDQVFFKHAKARKKLEKYFDVASIIVRFKVPGIEKRVQVQQIIDGPESSSDAYVIFKKKD